MERTKLTNFILKNLQWTSIFLYEVVYYNRLNKFLSDIKDNIDNIENIENISHENNDVIHEFSKDVSCGRILYRVEVK